MAPFETAEWSMGHVGAARCELQLKNEGQPRGSVRYLHVGIPVLGELAIQSRQRRTVEARIERKESE